MKRSGECSGREASAKDRQKTLTVELIATDALAVGGTRDEVDGWGEGSSSVNVIGQVANVMVKYAGKTILGLRILPDGSVIVTNYDSYFSTVVDRNLRLTNGRPWSEKG